MESTYNEVCREVLYESEINGRTVAGLIYNHYICR